MIDKVYIGNVDKPKVYTECTVLKNVTVEIWDNPELDEASVAWRRQPDTEEIRSD